MPFIRPFLLLFAITGLVWCEIRSRRQLYSNLHSPIFDKDHYTVQIAEEVSLGTNVTRIVAHDQDEGSAGSIVYSLQADNDQRSLNIFEIIPDTGQIRTKSRVDREQFAIHRLTVRAEDRGSPSNSATASLVIYVLDMNDHAPQFENAQYLVNVSEVTGVGTVIARLRANDEDDGDNKAIKYSFVTAVEDFRMDPNTGDISVAQPLNREATATYDFIVQAQDQSVNVANRLSSQVIISLPRVRGVL